MSQETTTVNVASCGAPPIAGDDGWRPMSVTPGLLQRCLVTFEEGSREVTCVACYTGERFLEWELLDRLVMLPKELVLRWRPIPIGLIDTVSADDREPAVTPGYLELISRLMRRPRYS